MIFPVQIRAARSLLGMSQAELAARANLGIATVKRIEASGDYLRGGMESYRRIQGALEEAGVIFIDGDDKGGPGVRLKAQSES